MRNNPIITDKRTAVFTTINHDEVCLAYPLDAGEGHQDNGKQQHVYYSRERYEAKQFHHGIDTYPIPEPFTDGNFKR